MAPTGPGTPFTANRAYGVAVSGCLGERMVKAAALPAGRTPISSQRASPAKGDSPKSRVVWNTPSVTVTGALVRMGPT
jgi:hypothetical protein